MGFANPFGSMGATGLVGGQQGGGGLFQALMQRMQSDPRFQQQMGYQPPPAQEGQPMQPEPQQGAQSPFIQYMQQNAQPGRRRSMFGWF